MSRIFEATCLGNVVKIAGKPIVDASVLSEGVKASTGVALMQGDEVSYITSNATDIKDLITNVKAVVDQIQLVLTALDAVSTSPGSAAAAIALITALKTTLNLQKENLK